MTTQIQLQRGNIKAYAVIRETVAKPGAYIMTTMAYNHTGAKLGSRQQRIADDLKLEAKGQLTQALYAAGWHSEQVTDRIGIQILWWPPRFSEIR